jgi:hypothetical protein
MHLGRKLHRDQRTFWFSATAELQRLLASVCCPVLKPIELALPMSPWWHDVAKAIARAALEPEL